jgi:hypothetical protein
MAEIPLKGSQRRTEWRTEKFAWQSVLDQDLHQAEKDILACEDVLEELRSKSGEVCVLVIWTIVLNVSGSSAFAQCIQRLWVSPNRSTKLQSCKAAGP